MIKFILSKRVTIFFSVFVFCFKVSACVWSGSVIPPLVKTQNLNPTTVQRDAAIGSVINMQWISTGYDASTVFANCYAGDSSKFFYNGIKKSGYSNVFNTNVEGVGIRIEASNSQIYYNNPAEGVVDNHGTPWAWYTWGTGFNVSLIKTGKTKSGDIGSSQATMSLTGLGTLLTLNISGGTITSLSCAIKTPNLLFPIGDILVSNFGSSVGTVPSVAQKTQNLGLDCDAGANINVSLQGTQNPDVSTTSVLALTGQGNADVAKGVGVQLLYNGTPLILNNRIVLKKSLGGQETFPIIARYYQTKTTVSTGKANASATLDLTYQ
ncbi:fimbrial protein [Enterobacter asburiae]|uniref:fimbrial protein n=1 Tax=Enterobacter asburiae TaxID=61645 RepID=UPI002FF662CA